MATGRTKLFFCVHKTMKTKVQMVPSGKVEGSSDDVQILRSSSSKWH